MTNKYIFFFAMPVMKSVSLTVFVLFTVRAFSGFCPASVSEWLIFCLPHFVKVVVVNITLRKGPVDIWAG